MTLCSDLINYCSAISGDTDGEAKPEATEEKVHQKLVKVLKVVYFCFGNWSPILTASPLIHNSMQKLFQKLGFRCAMQCRTYVGIKRLTWQFISCIRL